MEEKSNKGLIITIIILSLALIASGGYIYYDKFIKKEKKEPVKKKVEKEELVEGYEFNLKDVKCEESDITNSCTKIQKVSYDGKNHEVKVVIKKEKIKKYSLYIDEEHIKDFISQEVAPENEKSNLEELIGESKIYVFDNKYLGFLNQTIFDTGKSYDLMLVDNANTIIEKDREIVSASASFSKKGEEPLSNQYSFDGKELSYWIFDCSSDLANQNITADKISISINENKEIVTKILETTKVEAAGGGFICYDSKNDIIDSPGI